LADPFDAAREGWLYRRRGGRGRRRYHGAGRRAVLTLRDRVLCTLAWLRLALPHQALAVLYGVDRSTISTAVRQITPLLASRGFATPTGVRLHPGRRAGLRRGRRTGCAAGRHRDPGPPTPCASTRATRVRVRQAQAEHDQVHHRLRRPRSPD